MDLLHTPPPLLIYGCLFIASPYVADESGGYYIKKAIASTVGGMLALSAYSPKKSIAFLHICNAYCSK